MRPFRRAFWLSMFQDPQEYVSLIEEEEETETELKTSVVRVGTTVEIWYDCTNIASNSQQVKNRVSRYNLFVSA